MATSTISAPSERAGQCSASSAVVIAASAGGIDALRTVLAGLPGDFPAPVIITLIRTPGRETLSAQIFKRDTVLAVQDAIDGDCISAGNIYLAPADHHLRITTEGHFEFGDPMRIPYQRASVDQLFESAAATYGPNTIGVILSGGGRNGVIGAKAVHDAGGVVIAQDEATSRHFSMPRAAIEAGATTNILPLADIAERLKLLATHENGLAPEDE